MKIFLDTEFTGLHQNTTLISLGLVSECGKTFYAEFTDYDKSQVDDWLRDNVIANLTLGNFNVENDYKPYNTNVYFKGTKDEVNVALAHWLDGFDKVEIWSDCLSYDWVLFCNIFGSTLNVPQNIYYIPFDICTMFKLKDIDPDISRETFIDNSVRGNKHNALYDAKVIKACYEKLLTI